MIKPVPKKSVTIVLIEVKSCSALLRAMLVCTNRNVKSVLRCKFVILDTYHPHTIFTRTRM
jgi:hypothetical protein